MERRVKHTGKVGYTTQKLIIASLKATAVAVQLDLKQRLHVKIASATTNIKHDEKNHTITPFSLLLIDCL